MCRRIRVLTFCLSYPSLHVLLFGTITMQLTRQCLSAVLEIIVVYSCVVTRVRLWMSSRVGRREEVKKLSSTIQMYGRAHAFAIA